VGVGVVNNVSWVGVGVTVGVGFDEGTLVDVGVGTGMIVGVRVGVMKIMGKRVGVGKGVGVEVPTDVGVEVGVGATWSGVEVGVRKSMGGKSNSLRHPAASTALESSTTRSSKGTQVGGTRLSEIELEILLPLDFNHLMRRYKWPL
jgi:hypothetical protein